MNAIESKKLLIVESGATKTDWCLLELGASPGEDPAPAAGPAGEPIAESDTESNTRPAGGRTAEPAVEPTTGPTPVPTLGPTPVPTSAPTTGTADPANARQSRFKTSGINLATMGAEAVEEAVDQAARILAAETGALDTITEIHFYAAGLVTAPSGPLPATAESATAESATAQSATAPAATQGVARRAVQAAPGTTDAPEVPRIARDLDKQLRTLFPNAIIEYASDLLDAARAVCGSEPGIAAILGTGSNTCLYDGRSIVRNVRSGGFILGDEGGGACLGKLFISDLIKGLVPESLDEEFRATFPADYLTIVQNVYKSSSPAKYLGSFAPWILQRTSSSDYLRTLVETNLRAFIERSLLQYDTESFPVGLVGGFAAACKDILLEVARPYGIRFSKILPASMDGLVDYHLHRAAPTSGDQTTDKPGSTPGAPSLDH